MLQNKIIFILHFALLVFFIKLFTFEIITFRYASAVYVGMYVPHMTFLLTSSLEFASNARFI